MKGVASLSLRLTKITIDGKAVPVDTGVFVKNAPATNAAAATHERPIPPTSIDREDSRTSKPSAATNADTGTNTRYGA